MARILTGIQATGEPHLGNLLGAILPGIELSRDKANEAFFFIADMHSLTTVKDPEILRHNTYSVAASWLACGFDTENGYFYRQSDVPEVTELTWYLSCLAPFPMLANAHSFKDKSSRLHEVNSGLFTYPVLMAADILLYDANIVPVGKDQIQHVEMCRDLAGAFNRAFGETLVVPEYRMREDNITVPGIDGQKMSKSYGNELVIFQEAAALKKRVMKIQTDSTPVEEPKDPLTCVVYQLYSLISTQAENDSLAALYRGGNFGYGTAKTMLFEKIISHFSKEREKYTWYMANKAEIEKRLTEGAEKAGVIAFEVLCRVREKVGFKKFTI